MAARRTLLLAINCAVARSYVVPHTRLTARPLAPRRRAAPTEEAEAKPNEIVMGAAFDVTEYPISTDEFVGAYKKWKAKDGIAINGDEARRDIQAFMTQEDLMEKWRPILQAEAEEANKMTPVDYVNAFTSVALPLAVGFTLLPLIRRLGEGNALGEVIFPKVDSALELLKGGAQKAINLPICLEFGDC
jgi:hypothetical protein